MSTYCKQHGGICKTWKACEDSGQCQRSLTPSERKFTQPGEAMAALAAIAAGNAPGLVLAKHGFSDQSFAQSLLDIIEGKS